MRGYASTNVPLTGCPNTPSVARSREEREEHQTAIFPGESHAISCKRRMPSFARERGPGALLGTLLVKKGQGMSTSDDSAPGERLETFHDDLLTADALSHVVGGLWARDGALQTGQGQGGSSGVRATSPMGAKCGAAYCVTTPRVTLSLLDNPWTYVRTLNQLRVVRSAEASHMSHGGRQRGQTRAVRSEEWRTDCAW